jgi:hypothetical protein
VWRVADGNFYAAVLQGPSPNDTVLYRSTDDCQSFQFFSTIHLGTGGIFDGDDKELLVVDNNATSPFFGRFYVAWADFDVDPGSQIRLARSDDGTTWDFETIAPAGNQTQGAWPLIAPNGDVYVTYVRFQASNTFDLEVLRSTNGAAAGSFVQVTNPVTGATRPFDNTATSNCGRAAINGNIRVAPFPQMAATANGCLHITYMRNSDGDGVNDASDVYYRRSCDAGAVWDTEVLINDDGTATDQWFPSITARDELVSIAWYDRRNDPNNLLFEYFQTNSNDSGASFLPANSRISTAQSPVYVTDPQTAVCYHGDYDFQVAVPGAAYLTWSDDRNVLNGHNDPDIFFACLGEGPSFTSVPGDVTLAGCDAATIGTAVATDPCNRPVSITNDAPNPLPPGTTIVTWTATDATGHVATAVQRVTSILGDDPACCPAGTNVILGTSNNDNLVGTAGPDCILGLGAQDTIAGLGGNDFISGGHGDDNISGGSGNDVVFGGSGQDILNGGDGDDSLNGGDGDDVVNGGAGNDTLSGGQGQDQLNGQDGNDDLAGNDGDDTLSGGNGNDDLVGGPNNDTCNGGTGTNTFAQCEFGAPNSCANGVQDGTESDVDCGGGCPACSAGDTCTVGGDCVGNLCVGGVCQAPGGGSPIVATVLPTTDWGGGYCMALSATNTGATTVTSWSVTVSIPQATTFTTWNGNFTGNTGTVTITPAFSWNQSIASGATDSSIGFCANRNVPGAPLPTVVSTTGS